MSIPDRERKVPGQTPGEERREDDFSGEHSRPVSNERTDEPVDLDGDGFIGHTGGFYGGTSYLGSNYSEGWNTQPASNNQQESDFGAAGQNGSAGNERSEDRPDDERGRITKDDRII